MNEPINTAERLQAIGQRLRLARKHAGLSQIQASRVHTIKYGHHTQVKDICATEYEGRPRLSVRMLLELCEIYGVSEVWVLTGHNPVFDPQRIVDLVGAGHPDLEKLLSHAEMTDR